MHRSAILFFMLIAALCGGVLPASAQRPERRGSALELAAWLATWGSAQQSLDERTALPTEHPQGATLRQIVHLSVGGDALRLHLSNAFGTTPLHLRSVHVALPAGTATDRIDPASDRAVLFDGQKDVVIPAGAEYTSDPFQYPVKSLSDLAITLQIEAAPQPQTDPPGSRATSYLAQDASPGVPSLPAPRKVEHWYFLSGVDVAGAGQGIVILGDSITDGHGATTDGNDRWTDRFAQTLHPGNLALSIINAGIGGNRLLQDGIGPNALARFDRGVPGRSEARYLIVFEGIMT